MKYCYFRFIDSVFWWKMYDDVTYSTSSVPNQCDFLLSNKKANDFLFIFCFLYGSEATISSDTEEKSHAGLEQHKAE